MGDKLHAFGLSGEYVDGERWLRRRLNSGELRGVKVGRRWRMRGSDIDYMLAKYSNDPAVPTTSADPEPITPQRTAATSIVDGLSERSRRRLRRVQ